MVTAHKLLAHQQKDGDSPVNMVVQGFPEKSRLQTMDGLRRFTMVDTHSVKVGDFVKTTPHKSIFRSVTLYKEFPYRSESE